MEEFSELKSARLLSIYARLLNGRVLKKALLAQEFGVTALSIQRDLESLRSFLSNEMLPQDVVYDRAAGGYRLTHARPVGLSNSEILAVCKILLESRSMRRDEMLPILDKLVDCCVPEENKRAVQQMIGNEKLHYIEPHHGQPVLRGLWGLGQAVQQRHVLELDYQRLKGAETVRRTVEPVGILFSEYYSIWPRICAASTGSKALKTRRTFIRRSTASTASVPSAQPANTSPPPMPDAFRRANSAGAYSSCTAASCKRSGSDTPARQLKQCSTGSRPPKFSRRTIPAGQSRRRSSARGLKCG